MAGKRDSSVSRTAECQVYSVSKMSDERDTSVSKMADQTDFTGLLELLPTLTDRDSMVLQAKINNYLARAVSARLSFLAFVSPDEEELVVHVLGDQTLPARVKIDISTPCFDLALSTQLPATLKTLDQKQQEQLLKVLHLLHFPAHLAASRQTSLRISTVSRASSPGRRSSQIPPQVSRLSSGTPESCRSGKVCEETDKETKNRTHNAPSRLHSSTEDQISAINLSNVIPSSANSSGSSESIKDKTECSTNSTVIGTLSCTESSREPTRNPLLNDNVSGTSPTPSIIAEKTHSSIVRYSKPESFLCVPIPNPDNNSVYDNEQSGDSLDRMGLGKRPQIVVLACFIDKISSEKGRKRSRKDCEYGEPDNHNQPANSASECTREIIPRESSGSREVDLVSRSTNEFSFDEHDVRRVQECFRFTLPLLLTTLAYEAEQRQRSQCQNMLNVAQNLFNRLEDVSLLLQEIMSEARCLTDAERCSLFLLDEDKKELVAKVFDGQTNDGSSDCEVRLPSTAGIAGHVATTGKLLNIKDAYTHPLFYRGFDEKTGFRTRNLLCFPIQAGENDRVIGVAELCNKTTGRYFTQFDEQLATSFSVFCGIAITHSLLYNKVSDAHARNKLSNELMMLHMNVTKEEVEKLTQLPVPEPSILHPEFFSFSFFPRVLSEPSSPLAVIAMMTHLEIPQRWSIPSQTLARFVLMVRKGYRDPPYHNWVHAFSVTHFAFLLINNLNLCGNGAISEMEALALMISSMCHDLDHRGTTNSFQVDSNSVLASLYSSEGSVMERHHLAQAMCILNTESCNIFENLSKEEYTQCLDLMRDIILATDLAHHLRLLGELKQMAKDGYDPSNARHRHLCICLLMTSADLSDQTKDWHASRKVAKLIYKEFFSQGDLEKAMGNNPLVMMDRDKAFIPELQLSFLDNIALPVYQLVAEIFPAASAPYESVLDSRRRWTDVRDSHLHRKGSFTSSLDIFDEDFNG